MPAARSSRSNLIEIPDIQLQKLVVQIIGETPLLTNKVSEEAIEKIEKRQQNEALGRPDPRDPQAEFEAAQYRFPDGRYAIPAVMVKQSLVGAARFAGGTMTMLRGALQIPAELLEIKGPPPQLRRDMRRLQGRTLDPVYRPAYWTWEIEVPILYQSNLMGRAQVLNLFQYAGFCQGLGDWRPEKDGTMGQFRLGAVIDEVLDAVDGA